MTEHQHAEAMTRNILAGFVANVRESPVGQMLGQAYDSELARGMLGAARDIYREVFERGWTGRYWIESGNDRQAGNLSGNFYGWENAQKDPEAELDKEQDRDDDDRQHELDVGH